MPVLAALARSLESPNVPLTSPKLAEWLNGGKTRAGVAVTEQRAMGLTAYLRAVNLLSGACALLPLKVYRKGTRERITMATVLDNPNRAQTPFEFWRTMYANALVHGTSYALKSYDGAGIVRTVRSVHPSRVRIEAVAETDAFPDGRLFLVRDRAGVEHRLSAREVLMLPYLSVDGIVGMSPLAIARQTLGVAIAAENNAAQLFGKGSRISGVLQSKKALKNEAADRMKERWIAKVAGTDNAGDIAVLDNDTEFKPIALPPADAQLLESRKFSVTEIARLFGIPPHLLGDVEKSTSWGSGIEQQTIGFIQHTLQPWLEMVEQRVDRELLPGGWANGSWYCEYSLEGLLRGDSKSRAEFYRAMVSIGALKLSQVQALENLEPDQAVDFYTLPSNMTVVKPDGTITPLAAKRAAGSISGGASDA